MDSTTYRGLTFLLSLGTLPIACTPEKGESESDGTTGGASTVDTTGTGTSTDPTTGTGTDTGGTGTGTDATGTPTTGTETTGGGDDICKNYAAWYIGCNPEGNEAETLMYCTQERMMFATIYGAECAGLFDEVLVCLSASQCDDPNPCEAQIEALYNCSPPIDEVCNAYAMKYAECTMENPDQTAKYCQTTLNQVKSMFGPECGTAYEEFYACLTGLSCMDFEMQTGCDAQLMKIEQACGG